MYFRPVHMILCVSIEITPSDGLERGEIDLYFIKREKEKKREKHPQTFVYQNKTTNLRTLLKLKEQRTS